MSPTLFAVLFLKCRTLCHALARYSETEIMVERGSHQEKTVWKRQVICSWHVSHISWLQSPDSRGYRKWFSAVHPGPRPSSPATPVSLWMSDFPVSREHSICVGFQRFHMLTWGNGFLCKFWHTWMLTGCKLCKWTLKRIWLWSAWDTSCIKNLGGIFHG